MVCDSHIGLIKVTHKRVTDQLKYFFLNDSAYGKTLVWQFSGFYQNEHSWSLFGVLTHQGQETHVCVNEVGCHLLRQWLVAYSDTLCYVNQWRFIVN